MEYDFMKRGYLLPAGCKDLIDVLHLKSVQASSGVLDISKLLPGICFLSPEKLDRVLKALSKLDPEFFSFTQELPAPKKHPAPPPPVTGEIVVSKEIAASQLAPLLHEKLSRILADIMELGFFVTSTQPLSFEIVSRVARKHGFFAIKAIQ